jgi:transposase-like protein
MPIDPKGISPGLATSLPKDDTVHMKCPQCPSMVAVIVKFGSEDGGIANPQRLYRCVQCNHTRGLNVGGVFNH